MLGSVLFIGIVPVVEGYVPTLPPCLSLERVICADSPKLVPKERVCQFPIA